MIMLKPLPSAKDNKVGENEFRQAPERDVKVLLFCIKAGAQGIHYQQGRFQKAIML
jgi:hypothetical protein